VNDATLIVIAVMAVLLTLATVYFYERHLQRLRWELEEAIADADLATDLLVEHAKRRHPSATYGGANLRLIAGGDQ
jgi:type II secretory pathway pseudopilin PulG